MSRISDANPARCDWNIAVVVPTNNGAKNAVTVPLKLYSAKNCVAISGGDILAINVRDAESPVTKNSANTWNMRK